jgi:nitrite reductase/ring-hydroxylating ferredoxin subunit
MTLLSHDTSPAAARVPAGDTPADAHDEACESCLDRRQLLARAGVAGLGVAAVGLLPSAEPVAAAAGGALAKVADIPVGGAVTAKGADGKPIIVSQPQEGTFVALTAVCPHKGCEVKPHGKDLLCPCHASIFTLTGGNVSGPAKTPLAAVDVHVSDGVVLPGKA